MTSVMIVHEHHLLRGALSAVLGYEPDLDVTAQLSPTDDIPAAARRQPCDVIVIHVAQCDSDGLALPLAVRRAAPDAAILVIAERHTPDALRTVVEAGISGFIDADTSPEAVVTAIRQLAAGERAIDAPLLVAALRDNDNPLSPRQRDVLRMAAEGMDARAIGRKLFLSPGTVRNYLSEAVRRTGARSLLEAIGQAARRGWL